MVPKLSKTEKMVLFEKKKSQFCTLIIKVGHLFSAERKGGDRGKGGGGLKFLCWLEKKYHLLGDL